jgi:hypothetical protein
MSWRHKHDEPVVEITSAPTPPGEEIAGRERRYLISMGIRTACFIAAVLSMHILWLAAVFLFASFILPAIAVVVANSASPRIGGTPTDPGLHLPELGPSSQDDEDPS